MSKTIKHRRTYRAAPLFAVSLFLFLLLCPVLTATAMNNDYLQEEKWRGNRNVVWEEINATSVDRAITGWFGWYLDSDRCLYTYFAVSGDLPETRQNARIAYHVHTDSEEYDFAANADGICDTLSDEAARLFDVHSNFEECGHGVYLTAVQYLGKEPTCRITISFYADGVFPIAEEINADLPAEIEEEEPTQHIITKDTTTKAATTKESTTKRSGSNLQSAAGKASGSTVKTTATTKFEPQGNYFAGNSAAADTAETAAATNGQVEEGKTVMAKDALLLLAVGVLILLVGGGFLIAYRLKNRQWTACDSQDKADTAATPPSEEKTES